MLKSSRARNVVIGAGAMGSASVYHLARRGEPVTLIEQFGLGHDRGGSHGAARITRHSYADPRCARLMLDAFAAWRTLEAEAGEALYIRTGGISLSPSGEDYVCRVAENLAALGVPHRRMSGRDWNRLQPTFRVPENHDAVFEPDAGIVKADRSLQVEIQLAKAFIGEKFRVLERTPVRRIDLEGTWPTVVCDGFQIEAERLIVTAGAWTARLATGLADRLRPTRQQVLYFRPSDAEAYALGRFPIYIYKGLTDRDAFYGMPSCLGMGVKLARHWGPEVDPDVEDREVSEAYRDEARAWARGHIPGLAEAPIERSEICLYTMAPEERFQIAFPSGRRDVIVASPCSGHGFKFSCLIGRVLAELARDGGTEIDLGDWLVTL